MCRIERVIPQLKARLGRAAAPCGGWIIKATIVVVLLDFYARL